MLNLKCTNILLLLFVRVFQSLNSTPRAYILPIISRTFKEADPPPNTFT